MNQMRCLLRRVRTRTGDDSGQVTPFVVILTIALIALAGCFLATIAAALFEPRPRPAVVPVRTSTRRPR